MGDPGQPVLPVKTAYILLPPGERIVETQVVAPQRRTLGGPFQVQPGQMQAPLGQPENWPPTQRDENIYSAPGPFPSQTHRLVGVWSLCGYHIAIVNLYPVQYNPLAGYIAYYPEMELRLQTSDSPQALVETQRMLRPPSLMTRRLADLVDNPDQIASYHSLAVTPAIPKGALINSGETYPYIIVTSQALEATFQNLAEFKTHRGRRAAVVTVEEIGASYPGQDLPEQIRNFIIDAYTCWQTDFVLLGGDDEIIPHRGLYAAAFGCTDDDIPSDLYFGALDGNWNTDGDQLWGEPGEADLLPEVSVGRAPVDDQDEAFNFVTKNIQYQQAPVLNQTTRALMLGEKLFELPLTYGGDYKDEILFGATTNGCATTGFPPNFTVNTLYDRDLGSPWWGGTLSDLMNDGLHLINHHGHTTVERALRRTADQVLADLTNDGINDGYFIIYSQGCYAASFDNRQPDGEYFDDCVAEAFVTGPHGAVAFVGNTRYGWTSAGGTDGVSQYFDRQFFDALFGEEIHSLGSINDDSKLDNLGAIDYEGMRWCYYELTTLGDPELDLWTDVPETLNVIHPTVLTIGQANTFAVTVESGQTRLDGASVHIRQGQDIYETLFTNSLGMAFFNLVPATPDTLDVSVTAHDHLPYSGTILARTDGPFPWYSRHQVDDDQHGKSEGNGDGVVNHGETVEFTLWLTNFGAQATGDITVMLRSDDPYVEILDSIQTFPSIPPEGEGTSEERYLFQVDGGCPDGHQIDFVVEAHIEPDGYWTSLFSLDVSAPQLVFENIILNDDPPKGNGNGLLEAGETALVMITVRNNGSAAAQEVTGQISVGQDPYINVIRGTASFYNINEGTAADCRWPHYKISASEESPPVHFLNYTLNLTEEGGYSALDSIPHALGLTGLMDDVEGSETTWTHGGTGDLWHLSQTRCRTPVNAWYCGSALQGEYQNGMDASLASPSIVMISGSHLTFWHWYDLEEDEDLAYVEVWNDSAWISLGPPFTGTSQGWVRESYDLSQYPSGTALQIRFRLTSDEQNCREGWYIDDVYVGLPLRFTLDKVQVSPSRGDESTEFTFSVDYISDQNYPPTAAVCYIDSIARSVTSADTDYIQGATFTFQTTLALGEHQHRFKFKSGLQTIWWPGQGEIAGPLVTAAIFQEDFETGDGGFAIAGPDWEWGSPTSGPGDAHSGQNVWATNLEGYYSGYTDARLETPAIDLTGVDHAQLSFWHWYSFDYRQARYDGGNVKISADGGPFQIIIPENGYDDTLSIYNAAIPGEPGFCFYDTGQFWHQETFDLTSYADHQIVIRFHFGSNTRDNYFPGWYIDDVLLSGLPPGFLPAVSDLSLSLTGDDVLLSWSWPYDEAPAGYAIYRGTFPAGFFTEPEFIATVTEQNYTDSSAARDPAKNYYYLVRAVNSDGKKSEPSGRVGEFGIAVPSSPSY
jgi:hypothetical protein